MKNLDLENLTEVKLHFTISLTLCEMLKLFLSTNTDIGATLVLDNGGSKLNLIGYLDTRSSRKVLNVDTYYGVDCKVYDNSYTTTNTKCNYFLDLSLKIEKGTLEQE